jgi:hypothetical protein
MENIEALWQQLENSVPRSMEIIPKASVQMGQLEKQNQMLKILLVGLGVIVVGAVIYTLYKSYQEKKKNELNSFFF